MTHQTGVADEEWVKKAYEDNKIEAQVSAFYNDMAGIYKNADLVVTRAGATTLAELAVLGKPAILIPYPHAADNHQEKNGIRYSEGGGALLLSQGDKLPEELGKVLGDLLGNENKLELMSQSMKAMGMDDASDRIVDICLTFSR